MGGRIFKLRVVYPKLTQSIRSGGWGEYSRGGITDLKSADRKVVGGQVPILAPDKSVSLPGFPEQANSAALGLADASK